MDLAEATVGEFAPDRGRLHGSELLRIDQHISDIKSTKGAVAELLLRAPIGLSIPLNV